MINRCLFSYLKIYSEKERDIIKNFIAKNKEIDEIQIIRDKPLPFINGKLAPAEYFYSLFEIEELNSEEFKPKIFLVIDKTLDGKCIKIGDLTIIELVYVEVK